MRYWILHLRMNRQLIVEHMLHAKCGAVFSSTVNARIEIHVRSENRNLREHVHQTMPPQPPKIHTKYVQMWTHVFEKTYNSVLYYTRPEVMFFTYMEIYHWIFHQLSEGFYPGFTPDSHLRGSHFFNLQWNFNSILDCRSHCSLQVWKRLCVLGY